MTLLDYVQWRNFENVVKKGMLLVKITELEWKTILLASAKWSHWEVEPIEKLKIIYLLVMHVMQDYGVNLICVEDIAEDEVEIIQMIFT